MKRTELFNNFFTFSKKEQEYKNNPELSANYHKDKSTTLIDGKAVMMLKFEDLKNEKVPADKKFHDMLIVKHTRYSTVPIHVHDYIEINIVYKGNCKVIIKDKKRTLQTGDVCIMDTQVPHTIYDVNEEDVIINLLMSKQYFTTSFLNSISSNSIMSNFLASVLSEKKKHEHYLVFHCKQSENLNFLIEGLICEFYDSTPTSRGIINSFITLIFSELYKSYTDYEKHITMSKSQVYIGDILTYIEKNYKSCSLDETAKHFTFHPNSLSRLIKGKTGKTFKQLVQEQRLNRLAFLLENSDSSIENLISEVGYQNYGHVCRLFKQKFNETPSEFRNRIFTNLK